MVNMGMDEQLLKAMRQLRQREAIGLTQGQTVPFTGADVWNGYEISWLNRWGKPQIALLRWVVPCQSVYSFNPAVLQAYFNGLAMQRLDSSDVLKELLADDLSRVADCSVSVELIEHDAFEQEELCTEFDGTSLDRLFVELDQYEGADASLLKRDNEQQPHTEVLTSNLLRVSDPATGAALWASVRVAYTGAPIEHAGLLRYLVSYRMERMEAETCIERIYMDVLRACQPQRLFVYARFTRRHGMDVNPLRCSAPQALPPMQRLVRQ